MINKKKVVKLLIVISLIIVIVIAAIQIRRTLARYESTASTERDVDVAFSIIDNDFQTDTIFIDEIYPTATPYEYTFTVSNFKHNKIAETDLEYEIAITTTTNLPLSYEIKRNGTTYTDLQEELVTDDDGTVYRSLKLGTTDNPFPLLLDTVVKEVDDNGVETGKNIKKQVTDTYILKVTFPLQTQVNGTTVNNRENLEYADLMEDVKIALTARQVIGD